MIVLLLVLCFLFAGEPDLWDNLHEWAMQATTVKKEECK